MNNVYLVRRNSSEYHYMWLMLGQHPLNSELKGAAATRNDPTVAFHEGEAWEYTVTGIQDGKMCHCFRQRINSSNISMMKILGLPDWLKWGRYES